MRDKKSNRKFLITQLKLKNVRSIRNFKKIEYIKLNVKKFRPTNMKLFNLAFNVVSKTSIYSKVKFRKLVLKKNSTHRLSRPSQNQNLFVKYNFSSKLVSRSGSSRTIRKRRSAIFSIRKQKLFFLKKRSQFYLKTKFNKLFSSKRKNKFNARFFSKNSYSSVLSNTLHKNKSN